MGALDLSSALWPDAAHGRQPQVPSGVNREWGRGLVWLVSAPNGRADLIKRGPSVPQGRQISGGAGARGFQYVQNGGGDALGALGITSDRVTFFSVFIVGTPKPWSATIYHRTGMHGQVFGSDGLSYRYLWDGSEWSYDTGLTFTAGRVVAAAHTVLPSDVICAVDGKVNIRAGLANSARSTVGEASIWFGQDSQDTGRTFDGRILVAGMVVGEAAWGVERLREWSLNPWQIFRPESVPFIVEAAAYPSSLNVAASNITSSGARATVTLVF